jgi:hypothetical protein
VADPLRWRAKRFFGNEMRLGLEAGHAVYLRNWPIASNLGLIESAAIIG